MAVVDRAVQQDFVMARWSALYEEAVQDGCRLAVFGAGQHTRWLMSQITEQQRQHIAAILDDHPHDGNGSIVGVPVMKPAQANLNGVGMIVVSSDRYEDRLAKRCQDLFGGRCKIRRIYQGCRYVTEDGKSVRWSRWLKVKRWLARIVYAPERRYGLAQKFLQGFFREEKRRFWHDPATPPHWEDHRLDLALWSVHRDPRFLACGVYSCQLMAPGCRVLDLCCGGGFYAYHFYSQIAGAVDAVDFDQQALRAASKHHRAANVRYHRLNVLTDPFPAEQYDVVCWEGAVGHFTWEQIDLLLQKIKAVLGSTGVLSGFEELEQPDNQSWDHPVALVDKDGIARLLRKHFKYVQLLDTKSGDTEAYFRCSDRPLPAGWRDYST